MQHKRLKSSKIGIIGMGYVGLPLACAFSKHFPVVGFDINKKRIDELNDGFDQTGEVDSSTLTNNPLMTLTTNQSLLESCNIYIVTVPTPVDKWKKPDLSALIESSNLISSVLSPGDLVIFESTVYPGVTEEICGEIIANGSSLTLARTDEDIGPCFFLGYSPERINPGDKHRGIEQITKITSGLTPNTATTVDNLYSTIIKAGTHKTPTIKEAEAAKVIENIQRDVNIALVNEFAIIFDRLNIDTKAVLEAAGTKWNFLKFWPGLVGGHCIGVDPYYLTHKAAEIGYNPEIILAGRRLNDNMSHYVATKIIKLMLNKCISLNNANVLVLGIAFKENCPDMRNSKVFDLISTLRGYHCAVDVYDPLVDATEASEHLGNSFISFPEKGSYDAIVMAVAHDAFLNLGVENIKLFGRERHVLFDVKYALNQKDVDGRL